MAIRRDLHEERQRENTLQTLAVIASLGALLAFAGWITGGWLGILFALFLLLATILLTPHLAPALIFRFYRARPLSPRTAPGLYELLAILARRAELDVVPRLYHIPSPMHNAFATGTDSQAAIGITEGILRSFTTREIAGILAHEISHIKHRDTHVMALADTMNRLTALASQFALFLVIISLPLIALGIYHVSWLPLLLLFLAPSAANLLQLGLSRTREYAADLEAARLTGDPQGLAAALVRLERLAAGRWEMILLPGRRVPEPSLLRTHPPTEERVRRLMELHPQAQPALAMPTTEWRSPSWQTPRGPVQPRPSWHLSGLWY